MRVSPRRSSSLFPAPVSHLPDGYHDFKPRESGVHVPEELVHWEAPEPEGVSEMYWYASPHILDPFPWTLRAKYERDAVAHA